MKRFEFANEVAKQLITISAAIITVVIAFYEKFFSHGTMTFLLVLFVLLLFVLSILAGVMSVGALANLVERQEWTDWQAPDPRVADPQGPPGRREFVRLDRTWAQRFAMAQQIIFALGLLVFIGVALHARLPAAARSPAVASLGTSAPAERPVVWSQLHPTQDDADEWLVARAVIGQGAECPEAKIGSKSVPMTSRSYRGDPEFPRTICEVAYPGHESANVANVALPARPSQPKRILVLGDTGCRITHYAAQACNRDSQWPFRLVAESAARLQPDLIIHVGDYHYREKPCADRQGCAQSPHGDNWHTWQADFFEPARALLTAAPWVMLRGNHENCPRAGAGWLLLLAPAPRKALGGQCTEETTPYLLHFRNLTLTVFDTAAADDSHGREERLTAYREQISAIASRLEQQGERQRVHEQWLLLHQPLWASYGNCKARGHPSCVEADLYRAFSRTSSATGPLADSLRREIERPLDMFRQWFEGTVMAKPAGAKEGTASKPLPPPSIPLILSGDVHMFQMFVPDRTTLPIQLVAGMGGDALESSKTYQDLLAAPMGRSADLFGATGKLWARLAFGFLMLTQSDAGWVGTVHDTDGKARLECTLRTRSCRQV